MDIVDDGDEDGAEHQPPQPPSSPKTQPPTELHHQQSQPYPSAILNNVVDDFSLQSQGIGIRFRAGKEMRIYEQSYGQMILEEDTSDDINSKDEEEQAPSIPADNIETGSAGGNSKGKKNGGIIVKTVNDKGYAFSFLRATYSLMALFVGGFLFILGMCILLFLFIDLATLLGATSNEGVQVVDFLAVLLSVPVFVYSLAMGMTLATKFVVDTFYGHPFLRSFGLGVATTDWIAFTFYLGIPVITFITTLFGKLDNWWEISLLTWFASILVFWCLFSFCELYLEIWACLELMQEDEGTYLITDDPWKARVAYWLKKAGDASVRTMRFRLKGTHVYYKKVDERYTISDVSDKVASCTKCISKDLASEDPYSFLANRAWNPFYDQVDPPERIHTLDEIMGNTSFVTRYSWSLEKLFCRGSGIRGSIPITRGEFSITVSEINSNIVCHVLGKLFILLLIISLLIWFDIPSSALGIIIFICVIFLIRLGYSTYRLTGLRKDIVNDESPALYKYWETYIHSRPKDGLTTACIFLELVFLYILPLIYLCFSNPPAACLFSFLGLFSSLRHHLNPRILLLESEQRKDYFTKNLGIQGKKWKKKSLLYHIVAVGGDKARSFWTWAYLLFVLFSIVIVIIAANYKNSDAEEIQKTKLMSIVQGYTYPGNPSTLPYPTCRLKKGFQSNVELQDFAFLSNLAYGTDAKAQEYLDLWFGPGYANNDIATIEEFKSSPHYEYTFGSAVGYKLITFQNPDSAILSIRGTQTVWDLCADAQLWLAAILFQGLRFALPVSAVFTPILNQMVWIVSHLESDSITRVAFYRETTGFVNYLTQSNKFQQIQVTGHSLGGGLAIITGSQSKTNAVAISGPNAKLSRDSFYPPLSVDDLNTYTFNVIPNRDPIPMIDDVARLYQNIDCTSAANDFFGCHDIARSICEIQFTCGSYDRPVLCECVMDYGYPEPEPDEGTPTSFIDVCKAICDDVGWSDEKCERWEKKRSLS